MVSIAEAIKILSRYDNEHYTPQTREAHRMAIAIMTEKMKQDKGECNESD